MWDFFPVKNRVTTKVPRGTYRTIKVKPLKLSVSKKAQRIYYVQDFFGIRRVT